MAVKQCAHLEVVTQLLAVPNIDVNVADKVSVLGSEASEYGMAFKLQASTQSTAYLVLSRWTVLKAKVLPLPAKQLYYLDVVS
jgi:hypothetical protein